MRSADVLVPTVTDRIDAELIEKAGSQLKLIANFGNGVETSMSPPLFSAASPSPIRRAS